MVLKIENNHHYSPKQRGWKIIIIFLNILDSERSHKCIDFTIIFFFYFCLSSVITFLDSKNDSIFFNGFFCDRKVNVVGTLRGSKVRNPHSFQKRREKQTKN